MSAKEIINEIVGLDEKISDLMNRFEDIPIEERIGALSVICDEAMKTIGPDVLRHRILLSYEAEAEEMTSDDVVAKVFEHIEVP